MYKDRADRTCLSKVPKSWSAMRVEDGESSQGVLVWIPLARNRTSVLFQDRKGEEEDLKQ